MMKQRLGSGDFVSGSKQMNEGQNALGKSPQGLCAISCLEQTNNFLIGSRKHRRGNNHAAIYTQQETAKGYHIIACEHDHIPALLQSRDFVQVMVRHLDSLQMVAFIQEHSNLVGTEISLGVKRVVVKHQWEVGNTVERLEKFQNH